MIGTGLGLGLRARGNTPYYARALGVLGSSLLGYWPCWDAAGTAAVDISGKGRNGAYGGTVSLGAAGIGDGKRSVNLNGTGFLNAYSNSLRDALNVSEGLAALWVSVADAAKWADGSCGQPLILRADDNNNRIMIRVEATGLLAMYYVAGSTNKSIPIGQQAGTRWIHFAFSWSKAGDKIAAYVNGARQPIVTGLGTWVGALNGGYACFGASSSSASSALAGRLAHALLSSSPASDAAIRQLACSRGVICFEGDSRSVSKAWVFPAAEAALPAGLVAYGGYGVAVHAVAGSTVAAMAARAATTNGLLLGGKSVLVVWAGVNSAATSTGAEIHAALKAYCQAQRAAGWQKIVLCTEIDAQGTGVGDWHTADWPELNAAIAADHDWVDAVADLGADARLQNALDTTYFLADAIHLTAAGYGVVKDIVAPALASVM